MAAVPKLLKAATQVLLIVLLLVAALVLWLRHAELRMIYLPGRAIAATPNQFGMKYDDVWLTTPDGVRLNAWFLHSPHPSGLIVLLLHGNAGNTSHRMEKYAVLLDLGADVMAVDYRGYGASAGEPGESGTYLDAQAAYRYLTDVRGMAAAQIVIYGESLGSAVAVDLASQVAAGGIILEEAFTSATDVGQAIYPYLPMRWLMRTRYDSLAKIGRIQAPLLIFHSRDDEFFPITHAQRLLAGAHAPKELVQLRGGHNDAFVTSGELYRAALRRFFAPLAAQKLGKQKGRG